MADPATQFQQSGISAPYQFTPTHYSPQYVNVPTEAGALWAGLGKTAMEAGHMLMSSPLNPLVKAQMREGVERAHLGTMALKHAQANPKWAYGATSESPEGASLTAPITQPVVQQTASGVEEPPPPPPNGSQQPTITRTGENTGVDQNGKPYHEGVSGSNQWIAGAIPPKPNPNLNSGMAQGGLVRGYAAGGPVTGQGDHDAILARMAQERAAVGLESGAPPGTYLNPATGNYEPLQGPSPSAQQPPSPGTMFAGRAAPPPPAPETPGPSSMPMSPQGSAISQITDQPGVALSNWQNANVHPVIAPSAVLQAVKNNVTTKAQHATYLPNGGVNGEPAYSIDLQGGGQTLLSASQIAKAPWGRTLMAEHNQSEVMEQQQGQPQPGQPQTNQPGNMLLQPQGQPQPGQPPPQPGQPPAAPGPLPAGQAAPQPPQTYPQVASDQGGLQGAPAAPGATAYNPAAYRMPQGPTVTQSGDVNPALMAGGSNEQAAAAAKAQEDAAKAKVGPTSGVDQNYESLPTYLWKPDPDFPNLQYAEFPSATSNLFWKRRYYKGVGMADKAWTADDLHKQQLFDEYSGPSGVPLPIDPKTGKQVVMDYDTIAGSNPEWQQEWLNRARDYKNHPDAPLPGDKISDGLSNAANAIKDAQRIRDKILYLKQNNIPMSVISNSELIRSEEAAYSKGAVSNPNPLEQTYWNAGAGGGPKNNFADELKGDYKNLNNHLWNTPGGYYENLAATPKSEEWGGGVNIEGAKADVSLPKTTDVSTIPALNKIGGGDNWDEALAHIQEVLNNAAGDYKNMVYKLGPGKMRTPDVDQINIANLADKKKGYIDDPTNLMWDKDHQKMTNGYGAIPYKPDALPWTPWQKLGVEGGAAGQGGTAGPSPTPMETVDTTDPAAVDKFIKAHPNGGQFLNKWGQPRQIRASQ